MGEIYQVVHLQTFLGQEIRNVYYYETQNLAPTASEWQDIVDEIRGDYVAELQSTLVNDWQWRGIERRRVDIAGLLSFTEVPTAGVVNGGSATDPLPTQVALLISLKGTTTKPNRARTYHCGFNEGHTTDSVFTSVALAAAVAFASLQSVLNGAGVNPLQRVSAQWNTSHSQVIAWNNIAGATPVASPVPATQRRRRIGVGI